jgi:hypothetical protein
MSVITHKKIIPGPAQMLTPEEAGILKVLAYFDIFHYPLTKKEIKKFLDTAFPDSLLEERLQQLLANKIIFQHQEFYSLHNNVLLVHRRKEGNLRAQRLLPKGLKIGRFLFHFPYVRAVCISGSLSKNFADEKADIDFFIITKANRLWLARTMMHLFKKLTFLTGHQHYFCMNYYIDEKALLIEPQNIFTAVEITTLLPVRGKEAMKDFLSINDWNHQYFPGYVHTELKNEISSGAWIKKLTEWLFDNRAGDYLDQWLFRLTTDRWQKKTRQGKRNKNGRTMNLITGKHFARSNPGAFQEKVLSLYQQKLEELKLH